MTKKQRISYFPLERMDAEMQKEIARLEEGMLLDKLEEKGNWTRVRRMVWADSDALRALRVEGGESRVASGTTPDSAGKAQAVQAYVAPQAPPVATSGITEATNERIELMRAAPLLSQPEGVQLAALTEGMTGRVVSRNDDWVEVQLEGWVLQAAARSTYSWRLAMRGCSSWGWRSAAARTHHQRSLDQ